MNDSYKELMEKIDNLYCHATLSIYKNVVNNEIRITFFSKHYPGVDLEGGRYCGFFVISPTKEEGYYKVCFSDRFVLQTTISERMNADDIIATMAGMFVYIEHDGYINHEIKEITNNDIYKKLAGFPRNSAVEFHKQLQTLN